MTGEILIFVHITGINKTLKPYQARKRARLKIYNTSALPSLLHGCETGNEGTE
jgi:hypothetical protein